MIDPNNRLLLLAKGSRCLYIQYMFLLDDVACQELFEGAGVGARISCMVQAPCVFRNWQKLRVTSSFWWSFNISPHHISFGMLIVVNAQEYSFISLVVVERLCKIGLGKSHQLYELNHYDYHVFYYLLIS